jgi:hypothetical protein
LVSRHTKSILAVTRSNHVPNAGWELWPILPREVQA